MFELINTSVPQGLIAGTRGFTTVAMTRGLPAALQNKLEALSSYSFRTTAHDETYTRENPVNFFHYILPQGAHVIGRVAACAFDYTGRTNRLAHLLVLDAAEIGSLNAANIVLANNQGCLGLSVAWSGEPRYLDAQPDVGYYETVEAAREVWARFPGGDVLRRQIAVDLEQRLRSGKPRPIYFKTSTAIDSSGEHLLQLFSGVIELLPSDLRAQVSFSTYATNVPAGTVCHLCGIYDDTPAFKMASESSPWVDCENACIVHAERLLKAPIPTSNSVRPHRPEPLRQSAPTHASANVPCPTHAPTRVPQLGGRMPLTKKNPNTIFYALLGAFAAVVLASVGFALWYFLLRPQQTVSPIEPLPEEIEPVPIQVVMPTNSMSTIRSATTPPHTETRTIPKQETTSPLQEKDVLPTKDSQKADSLDKKPIGKTMGGNMDKTAGPEGFRIEDILGASRVICGKGKFEAVFFKANLESDDVTNRIIQVIGYPKNMDVLTNESVRLEKKLTKFKLPRLELTRERWLLYCDVSNKTIYWVWDPSQCESEKPWNYDGSINPYEYYFGKDRLVFHFWEKFRESCGSIVVEYLKPEKEWERQCVITNGMHSTLNFKNFSDDLVGGIRSECDKAKKKVTAISNDIERLWAFNRAFTNDWKKIHGLNASEKKKPDSLEKALKQTMSQVDSITNLLPTIKNDLEQLRKNPNNSGKETRIVKSVDDKAKELERKKEGANKSIDRKKSQYEKECKGIKFRIRFEPVSNERGKL